MARPLRIEYPGAWYHVMNRGAGRGCVFPDEALCRTFLSLLGDIHDRFAIACHAYCLMGNHYHLLLHTPNSNLGRAMRHLDGVYTQRHNRRRETDGPLFRGRYRAQLIEDGEYLWIVSRYIHRNPIEAGLCASAADYRWSSYAYFLRRRGAPVWLKRTKTLRQFGSASAYRAFVEDCTAEPEQDLLAETTGKPAPPVLGSAEFIENQLLALSREYEIPDSKRRADATPVEAIIDALCAARGWQRQTLDRGMDKTQRQRRAMLMLAVMRYTPARLTEVAAAFDLHYSTAASAVSRLGKSATRNDQVADELRRLYALVQKMGNGQT
jgi:REP element-mobilizing transposase RayT